MAKRSRGTRPGRRRPTTRAASTRTAGSPRRVEPDDGAAAAGSAVADAGAPEDARAHAGTTASGPGVPAARGRAATTLAAQAADDYLYVAHDIRRIIIVAGSLLILMLTLFVLIEVVGIFGS